MDSFIKEEVIQELIHKPPPLPEEVHDLLSKAQELKGLSIEEASRLFNIQDRDTWEIVFQAAHEVKERVYGKRIVLFAPLYLSNYCINDCLYCGFRAGNKGAVRKALPVTEAVEEASALEKKGYKRLLLVIGEDRGRYGLKTLMDTIEAIYRETDIRILHLNAPPMDIEQLETIKNTGIGVYQVFQETYHQETYKKMHPSGKKRDFNYRLTVMDRAVKAGFKDVGIGVLLGLYDYRFDVLAAMSHSRYLYNTYGAYAHTISFPRLRSAPGAPLQRPPYPVSDEDLKRIIAVCRLALPSLGVVISTRERKELRDLLVEIGVSQISAGSKTEPGGYLEGEPPSERQFDILDNRPLKEVIRSLIDKGLMPSLCTSCYRVGRTGKTFTHKTLKGEMGMICSMNAILTLKEYLIDHSWNGLKKKGEELIKKGLSEIDDEGLKKELERRLSEIERGKRDIFF